MTYKKLQNLKSATDRVIYIYLFQIHYIHLSLLILNNLNNIHVDMILN